MRHILDEELALAALIGDSRDEADPDKFTKSIFVLFGMIMIFIVFISQSTMKK